MADITLHLHTSWLSAPFMWGMLCGIIGTILVTFLALVFRMRNFSLGGMW